VGQISTLNDLNVALTSNNLQATLDSAGVLTISTSNDDASATGGYTGAVGGAITGTAAGVGKLFNGLAFAAPTSDPTSQSTRANLVSQYNAILTQITNTSADSSYNGINLLNGDQLQLTFNETGKSKVNITGTDFSAAGLGLSNLVTGTDFIDNAATNKVLATLNSVSSTLRSQASAFGSNLSVVQTRQDFNKSLINVLQTGSANLTQADINQEAANSQALSTRQSLSVSALSLANQSQQSVLQLLR
jgi:flagellin-like hook-associated protein FlgL